MFVLCVMLIRRTNGTSFFGCSKAQEVWNAAGLWSKISAAYDNAEGAVELIFSLLETLDQTSKSGFAAVFWAVWRRRNDQVWNTVVWPAAAVLYEATVLVHGWQQCREQQPHQRRQQVPTQQ